MYLETADRPDNNAGEILGEGYLLVLRLDIAE